MTKQPRNAGDNIPTRVLVVFALVFPLGLPAAAFVGHEAYVDARKIEVRGRAVETRVFEDTKKYARNPPRWCKEWLLEYWADDGVHRKWFLAQRYRQQNDVVVVGDIGKTMQIWYDPGDPDDATKDPPQAIRHGLTSLGLTFVGLMGVISIYALIRRVFKI